MFSLIKYKTYTVTRREQGSYVNGRWVEGTNSTFDINASIQPSKPSKVFNMPESDRLKKWCTVYSTTFLRSKKEGDGGYSGDMFQWQGDWYEVRSVKNWDTGQTDHTESMAVRVELTPDEVTP